MRAARLLRFTYRQTQRLARRDHPTVYLAGRVMSGDATLLRAEAGNRAPPPGVT